jgi:hypothetical protein
MHALAFLLGSRAFDVARSANPGAQSREEVLPPIASTPETAAAWRRWRQDGAMTEATRRSDVALANPVGEPSPG